MPTTAINSDTPTGKSSLDQADYLKLLVTQLTSQNPLNPQSDTAFASQLAQFSALQETQSMNNNLQSLQANALIGQTVALQSSDNPAATDTGVVTSVSIVSGKPELMVNGSLYSMNQLQAITITNANNGSNGGQTNPISTIPITTTDSGSNGVGNNQSP